MLRSHWDSPPVGPLEASPWRALGTVEITCESTEEVWPELEVPFATATAAAWVLDPAGLVVCGGELNRLNVVASAEPPARPNWQRTGCTFEFGDG